MTKFYKTTVSIDILSEEPIPDGISLDEIAATIYDGPWVGYNLKTKEIELTPKEAATKLLEAGSEPSFFMLTADGGSLA